MSSPDLRELEKQLLKRTKIERRAGPKPVRLSNLIAQTAWLDGQLLWRDGRVVFQVGEKTHQIDDEVIRRTSRALERLEKRDLRRELIDLVANRRQKFGYLREIATIEASDLKTLCSVSRRQNPKAIERLGGLLVVESLVPELLEHSPTRALALAWPLSQPVLESLAKSEVYPAQTRELARFALANRYFEFWQKNADFPVVLCARLGCSGYELPESLEKIGPYSLSSSEIFELHQCGYSGARLIEIVNEIRLIPSVWPPLIVREPYRYKDLLQARTHYKALKEDSHQTICQTLFNLSKSGSCSAVLGAELLCFWLNHWYGLLFNKAKERPQRHANFVFNTLHSMVQKLQFHPNVEAILAFALEKSIEESEKIKTTTAIGEYLTDELSLFCDLAAAMGVEKARELTTFNRHWLSEMAAQPLWLELLLDWSSICEGNCTFYWELEEVRKQSASIAQLRSFAREIEKGLSRFPPLDRARALQYVLKHFAKRNYLQTLSALYKKFLPRIILFHPENYIAWTDNLSAFSQLAVRQNWSQETTLRIFEIIFESLKSHFDWSKEVEKPFEAMNAIRHVAEILPIVSEGDLKEFRLVLGKAIEWSQTNNAGDLIWNTEHDRFDAITNYQQLRRAFLSAVRRSPRFTFESVSKMQSLKRLHLMEVFDAFEARIILQGEQWYRFLARYPQLETEIRDCFQWSKLAGEELAAPPVSSRWRDYETKTPREMEFLRAKIVEQPLNIGLQKRLSMLETQWQTRDEWLPNELREVLLDASSDFARIAIEKAISSALRNRLRVVCGEIPANLELDNDWINAILLACEVEENRKWAVAILRNCARGVRDPEAINWREKIEGNVKFLAEMRERGKNLDAYTARNERQIGEYTLWIEAEPLQILQMGNRFDTCLSRGGINEHSAITNAIDANKKVIYARKHSNIVGRQLLCVDDKFELLSYYVYSTYQSDSKEKYALNRIFHEYVSRFAEEVGLTMADEGNVPTLCGASWYDDYPISWADLLEEPAVEKSASKSRCVKSNSTRLRIESTQKRRKITHSLRHTRGDDSSDSGVGFPTFSSS